METMGDADEIDLINELRRGVDESRNDDIAEEKESNDSNESDSMLEEAVNVSKVPTENLNEEL